MAQPPPRGRLLTQHTVFRVRFRSDRAVRLQEPPWELHRELLIDPRDYQATQALVSRNPLMRQPWLCETRPDRVSFSMGTRVVSFEAASFRFDGAVVQSSRSG